MNGMVLTYHFRLRPTRGQRVRLDAMLDEQRVLYNAALEERIDAWRKRRAGISYVDQCQSLTAIRADDPGGHGAVPAVMGRWTLKRLDDAFAGFFRRAKAGGKPGFPRFRSAHRWRSFGLVEWSGCRVMNGFIVLKGLDRALRVSWHRALPPDAVIKGATFTKSCDRWSVNLQIATTAVAATSHAVPETFAGVDVGVEHLAAWDDGETHGFIANRRVGERSRKAQRRAQRALARCRRGSKGRAKAKACLARIHRRTAEARATTLHTAAAQLTARFETVAVEKLRVAPMTRSAAGTAEEPGARVRQKSGLNRAILDAAFGRLASLIRYKAEKAGGQMVLVDARGTSQQCSGCGARTPKGLAEREHRCPHCGLVLQRDINAARNIRARGLAAVAADGGAIAPGEHKAAGRGKLAPGTLLAA